MRQIKTESGFKWKINEKVMDDAEILDLVAELDEEEYASFPKLLTKLLGKDGKKALYDHLRTEDGRVPYDDVERELKDIFLSLDSKKK